MTEGLVTAIFIAPASKLAMRRVDSVTAEAGVGLVGDRYHGTKHRHVTVQSIEDLGAAAVAFDAPIPEELTRRNVSVSGFVVPTRPGERIAIGSDRLVLEVVRIAAPCTLLDDTIGAGARKALHLRAGTVFRLLSSGTITVGDPVVTLIG